MLEMIVSLRTFDQYVVDVDFHRDSQQLREDLVHQPLICRPNILQTEGYDFVVVKFAIGNECSVFLVSMKYRDLVVPQICVHEAEKFMARSCVNHLVNLGHREAVFRTGIVEVGEVHAVSPSSV